MKFLPVVALVCLMGVEIATGCLFGLGLSSAGGTQMHVLRARSGPAAQPAFLSLIFDYAVDPTTYEEITYVRFEMSETDCSHNVPTGDFSRGFRINVTSLIPVLEYNGTATIFGRYRAREV
ncbi:uncharacterized protein LOC129747817 [Uranotaenia lowii]|uniref:uncharacterized protein LOC129747783 n=1 Tax=Uranotaenia lowii TaxID=190385 RepID=UPI00247A9482|nr:uncharacterized protein LOC129747783 [Uranotaenia lowii]XP_055598153.1 uncharacterized protein LOC129747817 [Uranotaenia lowii]